MALFSSKKNKYSTLQSFARNTKRKDIPQGLWEKCKKCANTLYAKQLEENLNVCPKCDYHKPLSAPKRIELLTDKNSFKEIDTAVEAVDTLDFEAYEGKLEKAKAKTGLNDAVVCGTATLDKRKYAIGVMDFRFIGGSLGAVVGEKLTRLIELATAKSLPVVIVSASGGARMHEGVISLMQMAKTSGALKRHANAGLPFISIFTHPTTGGVTASYASLGDIIIAEPGALIGFAGPRVIRDTTQAKLPEGFQSAEFLMDKGMIDRVVERKNLRHELSLCLEYFQGACIVNT